MTQLSTNTVVYDQIIAKVSKFIIDYRENKFPTNKKFLEEYQNLISFLNQRVSGPLTEFNPYIKGEPPVSQKFNEFTASYSNDINIISKQLDYMSANIVNSFNLFSSEIEQENSFMNRIKSKIKVLQMYSSGPSNDLYYFGNSFDSSDYIDFSKIKDSTVMPLIENGQMTLSIGEVKNWVTKYVYIEPESNGYAGSNHEAIRLKDTDLDYQYVFKDTPTLRNKENIRDNNPTTFFEYEQINIKNKPSGSQDFEFKYINSSTGESNVSYDDWSSFKGQKLVLSLVMESEYAQPANFVNILPYFGSGNSTAKDVMVTKLEITDEKDTVENILTEPIWISSSFIPSSLDKAKYFFYREAKIRFQERNIKKIKITFEQSEASDVKIKHLYYKPDSTTRAGNPYYGQLRFNPEDPTIVQDLLFPNIPWSSKEYNIKAIVPSINTPNILKSEVNNTNSIDVRLQRSIPNSQGYCVEAQGTDGRTYRITRKFVTDFTEITSGSYGLPGYVTNPNSIRTADHFSTENVISNSTNNLSPYISSSTTNEWASFLDLIVNWFNGSYQGSSASKYEKFGLDPTRPVRRVTTNSFDTANETRTYKVNLIRQYEILDAERRSIGLRDVSVGLESYSENAQIVSKRYDVPSEIEYITLSAESSFSGSVSADINDYIEYSLSFDDGTNWVKISSIESPFKNTPEVLAINQNIEERFRLPGVSYLFPPKIPASVKNFLLKIDMKKPSSKNITPILYSYKVGVKVKQS
jgi:hypothetical protein